MRVLIGMPTGRSIGGAELTLQHLLRFGRSLGVDWIVAFLEDGPMVGEIRRLDVECHVVRVGRIREVHRYAPAVVALARLVRTARADVVCSWMGKAQLYLGPAAVVANVPAVWYQHGFPRADSWLDRVATALPARGVITTSNAVAMAQRQLKPCRTTRTVHPGVDVEVFDSARFPSSADTRRALGLPADAPTVGFVGRLQRWKGVHMLLEAFASVIRQRHDARLVIVGGPHEYEPDYAVELVRRLDELALRESVQLVGAQDNVAEWMQAMDIVVHASDREPFGMVIAEAMAMGKPVVATAAGGPAELIDNGVDGLLVAPRNPTALAQAVVRLLDDAELAQRLGEAAAVRARALSTERYAREVISALSVLSTDGQPWHARQPVRQNRVPGDMK